MYAVPCLVSRATHDNWRPMYQETSIVSVFKGLGFKTVWLDGQGIYRSIDPQTFVQKEADISRNYTGYHGRYDDIMLPDYADALDEHQPSLIVMHMEGSHFYYHDRYPDSFKYFTPACAARGQDSFAQIFRNIRECGRGPELVNAYDNSIRYTDWFLNEAIGKLKNKNALFIYVSDHGEALGENGMYAHGNISTPAVWHVPMIWWGSERFIQNYPRQWKSLQLKTAQNTSHDNIFHSMLDCIGVESRLINKYLSLCKEEKPSTP
jgi:glucan phosphoethanolaminetransferase (alkaline phosphatase superfamily)